MANENTNPITAAAEKIAEMAAEGKILDAVVGFGFLAALVYCEAVARR